MKLSKQYQTHPMAGKLDLAALYAEGQRILQEQANEEEKEKKGKLSCGNTGVLFEENGVIAVAGNCHRLTFLRSKGIDIKGEESDSKQLMFLGGHLNEVGWVGTLTPALPTGFVLKREEEIGVGWTTTNGTNVTGRPDLVIMEESTGKLLHGIENKRVSSVWTARDILSGCPRPTHVFQAAHYALLLGVQYTLAYTCDVNYYVGPMLAKRFPQQGSVLSKYCSYNEKGVIKNVEPFNRLYELRWVGDTLQVKDELMPAYEESIVTKESIEKYFEFVSTMEERNDLGPVPTNVDHRGDKMGFGTCDYCVLKEVCSSQGKDTNLVKWLKAVQQYVGGRQ